MHYRGPKKEKTERDRKIEEIKAVNFSNLGKETDIWIQEAQRVPNKNLKRPKPRQTVIKLSTIKDKERT